MIGSRVQLAFAATFFVTAAAFGVTFRENGPFTVDYGRQVEIPADFGKGEFTLELRMRLDESFPVGPVSPQDSAAQRKNWFDGDPAPYSRDDWWFLGNFLIDGHNNEDFRSGTFSIQFYGGGRVRWLFGDGAFAGSGSHWAVQAYPAETTPSLLDGRWHVIALVRRWAEGVAGSDLELWIDGKPIAKQRSGVRTDMRKYWDGWPGFREKERGWVWGAEKQSIDGPLDQYEDFKGEISEVRFWSIARAPEDLARFEESPSRDAAGRVGIYRFPENFSGAVCNELTGGECFELKVADRAWHLVNPRRTVAEWAVAIACLCASIAGVRALRLRVKRPGLRAWIGMSAGMSGLGAFTWFDLPLLIGQFFKVTARSLGVYEVRTAAQWVALASITLSALLLAWLVRRSAQRLDPATVGAIYAAIVLAGIAVVRVASLHATDVLLDFGAPMFPLGRAAEFAGACAVAICALRVPSVSASDRLK